jgi:phosphoglucosamine mutase
MRNSGINVGGEQSGHVILSDFATTGDGLIAALQVLGVLVQDGRKASAVTRVFSALPQLLHSVRASRAVLAMPAVQHAVQQAERRLNGCGRLVIRPSGTEPVIRIMAEAETEAEVHATVRTISDVIAAHA